MIFRLYGYHFFEFLLDHVADISLEIGAIYEGMSCTIGVVFLPFFCAGSRDWIFILPCFFFLFFFLTFYEDNDLSEIVLYDSVLVSGL